MRKPVPLPLCPPQIPRRLVWEHLMVSEGALLLSEEGTTFSCQGRRERFGAWWKFFRPPPPPKARAGWLKIFALSRKYVTPSCRSSTKSGPGPRSGPSGPGNLYPPPQTSALVFRIQNQLKVIRNSDRISFTSIGMFCHQRLGLPLGFSFADVPQ